MSAPMVRAVLDGRKSQTRRVLTPQPGGRYLINWTTGFLPDERLGVIFGSGPKEPMPCPYGKPGDRLWVRETWRPMYLFSKGSDQGAYYFADSYSWRQGELRNGGCAPLFRPSIHMPRWASRITLEITGVRVERVQEISCADAIAEGIQPAANSATIDCDTPDPRIPYRRLWDSLNAKRDGGKFAWAKNPFVWVIEFERVP